ncbi:MAG: hypothetical protein KatS3mg129_1235 [Leptospiraceae bacterium]|nr:MAG: hypothetical protein KatS3mg129_1235 [Leptospiraceae bacterium]
MAPIFRFLILCVVSISIYFFSLFLQRKEYWKNISLWVRSTSSVIFLITCIGSVSFNALKWTDNFIIHIILISLSLGINLLVGFLNNKEYFASFHIILNFIAVFLITQQNSIEILFIISYLMTLFSILMCSQERIWERHLILSLLLLSIYHYINYKYLIEIFNFHILTILFIIICGISLTTHYRNIYRKLSSNKEPFFMAILSHIVIWILLLLNTIPYIHKTESYTLYFSILFIGNLSLSVYAKRNHPRFYLLESLIAILLFIGFYISLNKYLPSYLEFFILFPIVMIMYSYIYLKFINDQQNTETIIRKAENTILYVLIFFMNLSLILLILFSFTNPTNVKNFYYELGMHLIFFGLFLFLTLLFYNELKKKNLFIIKTIFVEYLIGFNPLLILGKIWQYIDLNNKIQILYLLIPYFLLGIFLFLKEKKKSFHWSFSFYIHYVIFNIILLLLFVHSSYNNYNLVKILLFLLLFASQFIFFKWNNFYFENYIKKNTFIPISFLWILLTIASYLFTKDINPLLTGNLWLFLSLIFFEIRKLRFFQIEKYNPEELIWDLSEIYLFFYAVITLLLFIIRFFLVDINSESLFYIPILYNRNISEIFSLLLILYWLYDLYHYKKSLWIYNIKNYFLDIFVSLLIIYFLYEFDNKYYSIGFSLMAILSYFVGIKINIFNRLIPYSFILFLVSLFRIGFLSSTLNTPSNFLFDQSWVFSLIALTLNTIYFVLRYKTKEIYSMQDNYHYQFLINIENKIKNRFAAFMIFPVFIGIAFFLYWSFSKTLLSLLWMVECFILFIFSIVFKERLFRITSMSGIIIILFRMIFYDLKQTTTLTKSLVFISVGIILLTMNIIYNKYKEKLK